VDSSKLSVSLASSELLVAWETAGCGVVGREATPLGLFDRLFCADLVVVPAIRDCVLLVAGGIDSDGGVWERG
jgi:hypothetical protein